MARIPATLRDVVEAVSPAALEALLDVQRELSARIAEADKLRYRQVERAQYEAELAGARRPGPRTPPAFQAEADPRAGSS